MKHPLYLIGLFILFLFTFSTYILRDYLFTHKEIQNKPSTEIQYTNTLNFEYEPFIRPEDLIRAIFRAGGFLDFDPEGRIISKPPVKLTKEYLIKAQIDNQADIPLPSPQPANAHTIYTYLKDVLSQKIEPRLASIKYIKDTGPAEITIVCDEIMPQIKQVLCELLPYVFSNFTQEKLQLTFTMPDDLLDVFISRINKTGLHYALEPDGQYIKAICYMDKVSFKEIASLFLPEISIKQAQFKKIDSKIYFNLDIEPGFDVSRDFQDAKFLVVAVLNPYCANFATLKMRQFFKRSILEQAKLAMSINILVKNCIYEVEAARELVSKLEKAGVKTNLKIIDGLQFIDNIKRGEFDIFISSVIFSDFFTPSLIFKIPDRYYIDLVNKYDRSFNLFERRAFLEELWGYLTNKQILIIELKRLEFLIEHTK